MDKNPRLHTLIVITQLLPYLNKYKVLTKNETEHLEPEFISTNSEKVQYLLSSLRSKDQIGQQNFIKALYESSKEQGSGLCEIIKLFQNEGIIIKEE